MDCEIKEPTNNLGLNEIVTNGESLTEHNGYEETIGELKSNIVELPFQDFKLSAKKNILNRLEGIETAENSNSRGYGKLSSMIPNVSETSTKQDTFSDGSVIKNGARVSETEFTVIKEEENHDHISGMSLMIDSNDFVICNYTNQDIRLIDGRFKTIGHYRSIFQPWDVAVIDLTLFIVSFPFVRMLQYFKIRHKEEILPWYPMTSGNEYYGIAYERGHVVATCLYDTGSETPCVHVMNMKGQVQTVLSKDATGNQLFVEPKCIAVNSKTHIFYVLDQGNQSIVSFTREGEVLSIVRNVCSSPTSMTLDTVGGTFMIGDSSSGSILLMNESLKVYKVVKARYDNSWTPFTLGYCAGLDRLLVTMKPYPVIRVFEL